MITNPTFFLLIGSLTGLLVSQTTKGFGALFTNLKSRFIHSVTVEQENDLFKIISLFIQDNFPEKNRNSIARWNRGTPDLKVQLTPSVSTFAIRYRGRRLIISCNREKMDKMEWNIGLFFATIKISGLFAKKAITELIQDALDKYASNRPDGAVGVFIKKGYDTFGEVNEILAKPLSSLIYAGNKHRKIKKDIETFLANETWYRERGIPYKRCYCLYGPPGTGKTSLILSLAREFRRDIYLLDLQSVTTEEQLISAVASIPVKGIIVLEDGDRTLGKSDLRLSISSFLNILDGPFTKRGLLLFLTTNHIERIDPAILRDGRIDVKEVIGLASNREIDLYLKLFYGHMEPLGADVSLPMASIQEICIRNKKDMQGAIAEILLLSEKNIEKITS